MFSIEKTGSEYVDNVINELFNDETIMSLKGEACIDSVPYIKDYTKETGRKKNSHLFDTVDEAVKAAVISQKKLIKCSIAKRGEMIEAIREKIRANLARLVRMELDETGYGEYQSKTAKFLLAVNETPGVEDIKPEVYTGDDGLTLIERRAYGVACCVLPSTGPASTAIHNGMCMIAAGNSIVFSPHPAAINVTLEIIDLMNETVMEVGGPENIFVTTKEATIEKANEMMHHPEVDLIVATGGPNLVRAALSSGKKAIGAGPGNPPVLVDETADIPKAGRDIIAGNSFENGIQCIGEKSCLVVESVADLLIAEMQKNKAYLIKDQETIDKLTDLVTTQDGNPNRKYIGKDAVLILRDLGIMIKDDIKTIIYEVPSDHITVMEEYLMPILPVVRVKNVDEGIEKAVTIEGRRRHSSMLHSRNVHTITKFAKAIQTTIIVKNGASFNGAGFGGEGYGTMTIAGPTGEGLTRPKSFTRETRCALVGEFNVRSGG